MQANPDSARYGEVFDRGYARYDGERRGRRGAITSLIGFSMKRAMGIRKSWTAKVMPFILYVAATIPLIVMIGVLAVMRSMGQLGDFGDFASYSTYFGVILSMLGLFVAICAPEMICVDRHERTLPLYFSRAINRADYVFAKIVAMMLLAMTMTAVPAALLWLGRQLVEEKARQAMVDNFDDLIKVLILGMLTSLMFGTIGLMISSLTSRKGVAIAVILIGFLVVTGVAQGLAMSLEDHSWSRWFLLLDMNTIVTSLGNHFFHDVQSNRWVDQLNLNQTECVLVMLGWTLISAIILRWRYAPRDDA
ncbi:MAG: ABC transporter permease [Thermomicrobiales bacterium]|nr:ABC transporter permease [Thermomicrobiales bacterium]